VSLPAFAANDAGPQIPAWAGTGVTKSSDRSSANSPDFAGAKKQHDGTLRIDPRHLGALENCVERCLMLGD